VRWSGKKREGKRAVSKITREKGIGEETGLGGFGDGGGEKGPKRIGEEGEEKATGLLKGMERKWEEIHPWGGFEK